MSLQILINDGAFTHPSRAMDDFISSRARYTIALDTPASADYQEVPPVTITPSRLRVSIPESSSALEAVTSGVHQATGFEVEPALQELDNGHLIVELSVHDPGRSSPREVTELIEQSAPELDVLSAWRGVEQDHCPQAAAADRVLRVQDSPLPDVARRAVDDNLATAKWHPTCDEYAAHWLLAVPVRGAERAGLVALRRREGYSYRFSALDASQLLASVSL
jgi:hypothetical protein